MNNDYQLLTSRNFGFITEQLQRRIQQTKLAFFGLGLASTLAEHCARLGFENFYLQDGDVVELSNLNRQAFTRADIGTLKSEALSQKLQTINPSCKLSVNHDFISNINEIKTIIDEYEIIINTIDCNQTYFDLIEYGRAQNKLVLCPYNAGWGALIFVFSKESASSWDIFDKNRPLNNIEIAAQILERYPEVSMLNELNTSLSGFIEAVETNKFIPQMISGASIASGLLLNLLFNHLKGEPLRLVPDLNYSRI